MKSERIYRTMQHRLRISLWLFLLLTSLPLSAQQRLKFSIASFEPDLFDQTAMNPEHEKIDGSGNRFAIIKVTSNNPDDDLAAYRFNFGNLRHEVKERDGELWVYVQKNAKYVTISREGYQSINRHPLSKAIEAGKVYTMQLSVTAAPVYKQMVQFEVQPAGVIATILVKSSKAGSSEELFGVIDASGAVAKTLELGSYTYRVVSENYHTSEGAFTLRDRTQIHKETVRLRANFAEVTLRVDADADIYVDGELRARRLWTGPLRAGNHQVECRQEKHRSSSQYITVEENEGRTFDLTAPSPITGVLAVTSRPLGATVTVDGRAAGQTPCTIDNLIIGQHSIVASLANYRTETRTAELKENETTDLEIELKMNATRLYHKPTSPYFQAGLQAGSLTALTATLGTYLYNINIEASYLLGLSGSEDIYWNSTGADDNRPVVCSYQPTAFGMKVGYGLTVNPRFRLTPQAGATFISAAAKDGIESKCHAVCATVGVRADYAVANHFGIYLAPEFGFAVKQSDLFKQLADLSSKIKGWSGGMNVRLGLCLFF